MRLLEALRNSVRKLEVELADSKLFDHKGDRGEFRERIIADFLRPFLPKCYGLGSGAAFSADGSGSKQLDVVIYDDVFSNVLFRDKDNSLFPCESIFGVIEVKSTLDSRELTNAIENIKSLHVLQRQPSDLMDILPIRRIHMADSSSIRFSYSKEPRNRYLGILFAYDGLTYDAVVAALNEQILTSAERLHLPDLVFNYKRGFILCRCVKKGVPPKLELTPCHPYDQYVLIESGADTLPLFFLSVNICLNQINLRSTDLVTYFMNVLTEVARSRRV